MKAPKRKIRKAKPCAAVPLKGEKLRTYMKKASYVGSPEHKDHPNPITDHGVRPRPDASICPDRVTERGAKALKKWIGLALEKGSYSEEQQGRMNYPRYIWYIEIHEGKRFAYEGRLSNPGQGTYKGYPIRMRELPKKVIELFELDG